MPSPSEPFNDLPTAAWNQLEAAVRRFEAAWRQGTPPNLDEFLPARAGARQAVLVELVHIDLEQRLKAGLPARAESYLERHAELAAEPALAVGLIVREYELRRRREPRLGPDEYHRRFPQYQAQLADRFAVLAPVVPAGPVDSIESLSVLLRQGPLLEPAQAAELNGIQTGFREARDLARELMRRKWLTAFQVNQLFQGKAQELTLGPYVLLERLGEGGMGQVFRARHLVMNRVVALKVIRKERLADDEAVRRFQREVRAVGQLNHPNIVIAHDAACAGETHFLVMEYVEGIDLQRLLKQRGPLPVALACDYVRQAALGLQHAHEKGLVHRDIKPANLMVTPQGVVKVLDLGLARLQGGPGEATLAEVTQEGAVMGTPDYMAPEQAEESHNVDIRADVYSLGCTLYALLAGQVPYPGGTLMQKMLRHRDDQPAPITALRPDVPPRLAAVLQRMMARRPEDRCQTPAEVALLLELFCGQRPPVAVPVLAAPGVGTQQAPLALPIPAEMRHAAGPAPVALLVTAGAPAAGRTPVEETIALEPGATPPPGALPAPRPRRRFWALLGGVGLAGLVLATLLLWRPWRSPGGPPPDSGSPLDRLRAADVAEPDRALLPREIAKDVVAVLGEHRVASSTIRCLAMSPAGDRVAIGTDEGLVRIGDVKALRQVAEVAPGGGQVYCLALDTDGRWLAGGDNKGAWVCDLRQGTRVRRLEGHTSSVWSVAFSPRASLLLSGGEGGMILWDLGGAPVLRGRFTGHPAPIRCLAFSSDGQLAVSATWGKAAGDGTLLLWDVGKRQLVRQFKGSGRYFRVVFSPSGKEVVSADDSEHLRWWSVDTGEQVRQAKAWGQCSSLAISRDGARLLSGHRSGPSLALVWWDAASGKQLRDLRQTWALAELLPDGRRVVHAVSGILSTWDAESGKIGPPPVGHTAPVGSVCFSADGRRLLSCGRDLRARLWDLQTGRDLGRFPGGLGPNPRGTLSPSGRWALISHDEASRRALSLWDVKAGQKRRDLPQPHPYHFSFLESEERALTLAADGVAREWDLQTGKIARQWKAHPPDHHAIPSPDGNRFLSSSANGVVLIDRAPGAPGRKVLDERVTAAVFTADGKRIYFARSNGVVGTLDLTAEQARPDLYLKHHEAVVYHLAVAPDGKRLASADVDGRVILWDTATWKPIRNWRQSGGTNHLAFAPDSRHLALANGNTTIYIVRVP